MNDSASKHERRRFGALCARLSADQDPFASAGPMRELAWRVAAEVRAGRPPAELADELDAVEDQLLRAGYTAGLSDVRSVAPQLPGLGGGHPQLEVFACPGEACLRVAPLSDNVPACRVLDRPLRRMRLG